MSIADGVAAGLDPSWPGMPVMVVAGAIAAAMAWAIGAQDVSNCFGTAVGSKALTVTQAVLIAAVCEFLGSLAGGDVAATLATGILDMDALTAMGDEGVALYMRCMLATMAGAVAWLVIATVYSLPVSTTHSLVGALLGVGLLATGSAKWSTLGGVCELREAGRGVGKGPQCARARRLRQLGQRTRRLPPHGLRVRSPHPPPPLPLSPICCPQCLLG